MTCDPILSKVTLLNVIHILDYVGLISFVIPAWLLINQRWIGFSSLNDIGQLGAHTPVHRPPYLAVTAPLFEVSCWALYGHAGRPLNQILICWH